MSVLSDAWFDFFFLFHNSPPSAFHSEFPRVTEKQERVTVKTARLSDSKSPTTWMSKAHSDRFHWTIRSYHHWGQRVKSTVIQLLSKPAPFCLWALINAASTAERKTDSGPEKPQAIRFQLSAWPASNADNYFLRLAGGQVLCQFRCPDLATLSN